jgi:hypothetical protein
MNVRWWGTLRAISLAFVVAAITPFFAAAQINSWTNTSSGYWDQPYWSAGHLPTLNDSAILITNAGWKAVAIGSGTTATNSNSLRISYLTVDAPVDSRNTLLLNWAGLAVPLDADGVTIGTNGALVSHYSAMDVGTLTLNGPATFTDFSESRFGLVELGRLAWTELNLSNGLFSAEQLRIATGSESTFTGAIFNQWGGSNYVSGQVSIDADGSYNLAGGNFVARFIDLYPTNPGGAPELNITGGTVEVERQLTLGGSGVDGAWPGMMTLSNGFFKGGDIYISQGQVDHWGGSNRLTQLLMPAGPDDRADYVMNGGRLDSVRVHLGSSDPNGIQQGIFSQAQGVHSNSQSIIAYGKMVAPEIMYFSGTYALYGGSLTSPGIGLDGGMFNQAGGTNYTIQLSLTNGGSYLFGGGLLVTSNTVVQNYVTAAARPRFVQGSGAEHRVKRLYLDSGGFYHLARGGLLSAEMIFLGAGTELRLAGNVSSNNTIEMNGGLVRFEGTNSLGWLLFNGISHFDFSGPSIVHFTKVGYPPPALDGQLLIHNWTPGWDKFYIDSADELTPSRVRSMTFVDPEGYPPGNYRAYRRPSGEIVPLDVPEITFTRNGNSMILTWPEGYQLYSANQVTGPFLPVANAQSGLSVVFTGPRRFFILRPAQ